MTSLVRSPRRAVAAAVAALLLGGLAFTALRPAGAAATDGPPVLGGTTPQMSRTAGGNALRIGGSGFEGTTSVTFGGVEALDLKVIDTNLLTVTVPPAPAGLDNASVPIEITDNEGTGGSCEQTSPPKAPGCTDYDRVLGHYYSDATMTLTPDTGVAPGTSVTVSLTGYEPDAHAVIPELNPLVGFLEGGPDPATVGYGGPPPYVVPLDFPVTGPDGSFTKAVTIASTLESTGQRYDPNVSCPPTQETADYGLSECLIGFSQFAIGTVEHHIGFAGNPTPAAPTLSLSSATAAEGDSIDLSGVHWNNNPYFGSDTTPNDPGETRLVVDMCTTDLSTCSPVTTASATVDLTRYKSDSTTIPITGVFSGATLSGSMTVGATAGCAPDCVVRVQQEHYDYDSYRGQGDGTFITATAPLTVAGGPTTTTSTSTTSTSTTSTTGPTTTSTTGATTTSTSGPTTTSTSGPTTTSTSGPTTTSTSGPTTTSTSGPTTTSTTAPTTSSTSTTSTTVRPTTTSTSSTPTSSTSSTSTTRASTTSTTGTGGATTSTTAAAGTGSATTATTAVDPLARTGSSQATFLFRLALAMTALGALLLEASRAESRRRRRYRGAHAAGPDPSWWR